ncbi:MAG TPA: hypothetical protein VH092_33555 [Urbifossiella sp.]|jgi:hypothetical protein|nr:hypothetical protein [Urbifossiella sp.]
MSETEQTKSGWWSKRTLLAVGTAVGHVAAAVAVGWAMLSLPALTEALGLGMEVGLAAVIGLVGMYAGATLANDARGDESSSASPGFPVRHALVSIPQPSGPGLEVTDPDPSGPNFRDRVRAERVATAAVDPGNPRPGR